MNIRELCLDDMARMYELVRTRDDLNEEGARKRTELITWLAFTNPFAGNEPTYYVAEDGGRIVAHLGRMPSEIVVQGKPRRAYFIHDLFVHPEYRKRGRGFFISMALYGAIEKSSDALCILVWTSDLNLAMQERRGYYGAKAGCYVKILNPGEIARRFLKDKTLANVLSLPLKWLLTSLDWAMIRMTPSRRTVSQVNRFDGEFDVFFKSIVSKVGICTNKSSGYLDWKFIDRPFNETVVFEARHDGSLKGVIILAPNRILNYPEGMIVDIIADPDDKETIISLVKEAIVHFRRLKVFSIRCCLTDQRMISLLRRFHFSSRPRGEPVMLANLGKGPDKDFLMDIRNWDLTYGESDITMLRA